MSVSFHYFISPHFRLIRVPYKIPIIEKVTLAVWYEMMSSFCPVLRGATLHTVTETGGDRTRVFRPAGGGAENQSISGGLAEDAATGIRPRVLFLIVTTLSRSFDCIGAGAPV